VAALLTGCASGEAGAASGACAGTQERLAPCPCPFVLVQVKRRILMGTYALSAGYYDAYYKRAQQVRPPPTRVHAVHALSALQRSCRATARAPVQSTVTLLARANG
jgi:Asp-tRNA(Asn)/Glu-tRNA(Gln) amidotransferase A subunit family amidase